MERDIFTNFINKVQKIHYLCHSELVYSYLYNYFKNTNDEKLYVLIAINESLQEIRFIGQAKNFDIKDKKVRIFFLSAYLYYIFQTFDKLFLIFNENEIISNLIYEEYNRFEYLQLLRIFRNTLHHPLNIRILEKDLQMIINSKDLTIKLEDKEKIISLLNLDKKSKRQKRYNFSLSYSLANNLDEPLGKFLGIDSINLLSFDRINNEYEDIISIGFDFDLILNKYLNFMIEILYKIKKEILMFSKNKKLEFNSKIKDILKIQDIQQKLEKLESFLFDEKNIFKESSDLTVESSFIVKNKIILNFINRNSKNKILYKLFNNYINKIIRDTFLYKIKSQKYSFSYSKKFNEKFSKFWIFSNIDYSYASEKLNGQYLVFLDNTEIYEEYNKQQNKKIKYGLPERINKNPKPIVNPVFYEENDPIYRNIYITYYYYFRFLIKNCINSEILKSELLDLFTDSLINSRIEEWKLIQEDDILKNVLLYDFLKYLYLKYSIDDENLLKKLEWLKKLT